MEYHRRPELTPTHPGARAHQVGLDAVIRMSSIGQVDEGLPAARDVVISRLSNGQVTRVRGEVGTPTGQARTLDVDVTALSCPLPTKRSSIPRRSRSYRR